LLFCNDKKIYMGRLSGKFALVSAAGAGIGRASALMMVKEGAKVIATDINQTLLDELKGIEGLTAVRVDARDDEAVEKLIADLPPLNVLFNCAGFVHHGTVMETSKDDWDFSFSLNVRAQYIAIKAALPKMIANGGGSIINMASVCSSIKGFPNRFVYGASKAAVIGLTKSIAADYAKGGIRCNAVCPGTVDTPSLGERINAFADPVQARKDFIARQPMGRLATAEEIAPMVIYLASDESKFATGNSYTVDGGITI
jgi:2-keto-3-deoxy-L-fuconate dehydrogenase